MNYYEHFLGDYNKKTTKLRLVDHGAYRVLLDTYYADEKPLPADFAELYLICRAIDKNDQQSVRKVADLFFPVAADGLRHNERADVEIARAQKRINAARENGKGRGKNPPGNPPGRPTATPLGGPVDNPPGRPVGSPEGTQRDTHRGTQPPPQPGEALRHAPYPIPFDGDSVDDRPSEDSRLPGTLKAATWRDWRAHLANKGKGLTPQSERLQLVQLAGHRDAETVVQNAIRNGHLRLEPVGGWPDKKSTPAQDRHAVGDEIFGGENDGRKQEPHDITGEAKRIA